MSNLEYGYLGAVPTQAQTSNSGILSMEDVVDLKSDNKYTLAIPRTNLIQHLEKDFGLQVVLGKIKAVMATMLRLMEQLGTLIYLIAHTVNFNLTLVKLLIG